MNNELDEFQSELLEILDSAEKNLLKFENPEESFNFDEVFDSLCRSYHNIKGSAGMLDLDTLQHHVHHMETQLIAYREVKKISTDVIQWFLKANDAAKCLITKEETDFDFTNTSTVKKETNNGTSDFISESVEAIDKITQLLIKTESEIDNKEIISELYREIHSLKGACDLFNYKTAADLSHVVETVLDSFKNKKENKLEQSVCSTLLLCVDLISACIRFPVDESQLKEAEFMKTLVHSCIPSDQSLVELKCETVKKKVAVESSQESDKQDTSIRVQVSLLDRLMSLMGEMVLVRNQVLQYANEKNDLDLLSLSQKLNLVTSELQEETMKTRMQPIGTLLNKFQRVVRDLSGSLNKKINLKLEGLDTELDKSLIEAIKDPLTHIVRNACDHGIELPASRESAGKVATGTVFIKAYHEGGQVIVDIEDDGKGLSKDRILKKAVEKGIVTAEDSKNLSEKEIFSLIFEAGFSTAESVTNVSGRGVGMDVVRKNIEKIGGVVELKSEDGYGTKLTLKIPLTLAILPAILVRSGNEKFAVPQVKIVELIKIKRSAIELVQGKPIYRLRGDVLSLLDLKEILEVPDTIENDDINIIVLNSENNLFGLMVDEILDSSEIVVKPLAGFLKIFSTYSGATVLGDGSVIFILDVFSIYKNNFNSEDCKTNKTISVEDTLLNQDEINNEFIVVSNDSINKYVIPMNYVSRLEEIKSKSIEFSGNQSVIRYRGGVIKVIDINQLRGDSAIFNEEVSQLVILKYQDSLLALKVNKIEDVLASDAFFDRTVASTMNYISGNLVLKNEIAIVFDIEQIFEHFNSKPKKASLSVKTVLFVEDTDSIREKIKKDLESSGFNVLTAVNGLDGLQKITSNQVDFIISDIEMPEMNGFEFAQSVKKNNKYSQIPLIAFTSKNDKEHLDKARKVGFSDFVEKKKSKDLVLILENYIEKEKRDIA